MNEAELIEGVARRVVELLREERLAAPPGPRLINAAEVANRFGVSVEWVRDHALDLGAIRLGSGPRPRLRFDAERVAEVLTARSGGGGSEDQRFGSTSGPAPLRGRGPAARGVGQLPRRSVEVGALPTRTAGRRANAPGPATRSTPSTQPEPSPRKRRAMAADRASSSGADDRRRQDG